MPKRVMKRRPAYKKRQYKRKVARKTMLVNKALQPFPQKYICKMRYAETRTLTTTSSAVSYYNWNLNSVFDPNNTGIGHQPYGYDQLTPLYNRYRVIAVRYRVISSSDSNHILWAIPSNTGATPVDVNGVQEDPRAKWRVVQIGGQAIPVNGKIYLPSLTGLTRAQYMADDRYQADVTSNPSEVMVLTTGIGTPSNAVTSISVNVTVQLEFIVEFFDPKIAPPS